MRSEGAKCFKPGEGMRSKGAKSSTPAEGMRSRKGQRVELLAPGGSMESIRAAVHAGADAVYAGGRLFGARAYADNPEKDALLEVIDYCHLYGVKLYLTVNTLLKEYELTGPQIAEKIMKNL